MILAAEWRTDNRVANEEAGGAIGIIQLRNNGGSKPGYFQCR